MQESGNFLQSISHLNLSQDIKPIKGVFIGTAGSAEINEIIKEGRDKNKRGEEKRDAKGME